MDEIILLGVVVFILCVITVVCCVVYTYFKKKKTREWIRINFGTTPDHHFKDKGVADYWQALIEHMDGDGYLDDLTWNDLGMEEVFYRINCCQSTVGEEWLYARLHQVQSPKELRKWEKLANIFADEQLRLDMQVALKGLDKTNNSGQWILMFYPKMLSLPKSSKYKVQVALLLLGIPLMCFGPIGIWWMIACGIVNGFTYFNVVKKTEHHFEYISYFFKIMKYGKKIKELLKDKAPDYSRELEQALAALNKVKEKGSFLVTMSNPKNDQMGMLVGMITLIPILQYCKVVHYFACNGDKIKRLFDLVGELDGMIATLSYRATIGNYCIPTLIDTQGLRGTNIYHPLINDPIKNHVNIDKNLLLTGSNASGKSTYIKAVAINAILGGTIHTCCGTSFELLPAPVVTSMAVKDSVVNGESYFIAEIKSVGRIIQYTSKTKPCYCFIDEILKGTNTTERVSASVAILEHLYYKNCIVITATHDTELTERLGSKYLNAHFSEIISDEGIAFDFKLKEGICRSRNAIRLLDYYGFPAEIISSAYHQVSLLEKTPNI